MHNLKIIDLRVLCGDSAFLIDDGKTSILYDSGFGFTGFALLNKIKEYLGNRELNYIFLTHSHYDHVLGSAYVLEYYKNALVVAGEYTASIFQRDSAKALMWDLDNKFAKENGIYTYPNLIKNLRVDIPLKDGDTIKAGDMTFTAIHLPGHTKCSFGFYLPENKLLLSTETLGVYNCCDNVVPSYLVGYEMALNSIDKALSLDIESILVPHYGVLNREETAFYLKKSKTTAIETAKEIKDLLQKGASKDDAIQYFKNKFYHGYIKEIYPIEAMKLNTGITVDLIKKELCK